MKTIICISICLFLGLVLYVYFNVDEQTPSILIPKKREDRDSSLIKIDSLKTEIDTSFKIIEKDLDNIKEKIKIIKLNTDVKVDSIDVITAINELRSSTR